MDIYREQTEAEKRLSYGGFKDVRNWRKEDAWNLALEKIAEHFQIWVHEKKKPYARKYAMDFVKKKLEDFDKQIKRSAADKNYNIKLELDIDLDSFADDKLFEYVGEKQIVEEKLIDGMRQSVVTGVWRDYICKESGEGISIEIKNHELEKLKKDGSQSKTQEKKNTTPNN